MHISKIFNRVETSRVLRAFVRTTSSALTAMAVVAASSAAQTPPLIPWPANLVGELEVSLPNAASFILRGTMPLERGSYLPGGTLPVHVLDYDGTAVTATQVNIVSRGPGTGGVGGSVDVIEIEALVRRDPLRAPGTHTTYAVAPGGFSGAPSAGTADVLDLATGPANVPLNIQGLVADPESIVIRATDPLSKLYYAYPLMGTQDLRIERYGPAMTTLRSFRVLAPAVAPATGDYPRLFGVHTYFSTLASEPVLLTDFRFVEALDNAEVTPLDDALGKIYWKELSLLIKVDANNWAPQSDHIDPAIWKPGQPVLTTTVNGIQYYVYPIVRALRAVEDVLRMHMSPCKSQFHRRMGIASSTEQEPLRRLLDQEGQAFCVKGTNGLGNQYWSWWNIVTQRYFPARHLLPTLNFSYAGFGACTGTTGIAAMRCTMTTRFDLLRTALATGGPVSWPDYGSAAQLGWARPYDVPNGEDPGGRGIVFEEGSRVAATAHVDGYRNLQLMHRMNTERHPNVVFDAHGDPTNQEKWLVPATGCPTCPLGPTGVANWSAFSFVMDWHPNQPFNPHFCPDANWNQNAHVIANALQPAYETNPLALYNLDQFIRYDAQHLSRYTRFPMALAWLGNDPLSKDDLRAQAELFRMTYTEYPGQYYTPSEALYYHVQFVAACPNQGYEIGRARGWGLNAVNAAYAFGDDATRLRYRPWYNRVVNTMNAGMHTMSDSCYVDATSTPYVYGILSGRDGNDPSTCDLFYGPGTPVPCPRPRQTWEEMIVQNAMRGMVRTVYANLETQGVTLGTLLRQSYYGLLAPTAWDEVGKRIWGKQPISDAGSGCPGAFYDCDASACSCPGGANPVPTGAVGPHGGEAYHYFMASIADAWEMTADPMFLERTLEHLGATCGTNCVTSLKNAIEASVPFSPIDYNNYDSWAQRALLLARMQL